MLSSARGEWFPYMIFTSLGSNLGAVQWRKISI